MIVSRRGVLDLGLIAAATATLPGAAMPDRIAGPQPGDGFVPVADPGGSVLRPESIRLGTAPILVWPKDRQTGLVRDGARFNQVLLLRVRDKAVNEQTETCGVLRDLSPCSVPRVRMGGANLSAALSLPRV